MSVGKPGYTCVFIFTAFNLFLFDIYIESSSIFKSTPISISFCVNASKCSGIIFSTTSLLHAQAPIIIYVPASILSGITSCTDECIFFTPFILIVLVPAPVIFAPILFKNIAIFTISGSLAALSIIVVPSAFTAASIIFIVAPTLAKSKYILLPFNSSALIIILFSSYLILAPRLSNPFKCKSIGLDPILHPPGYETTAFLYLPRRAPIK